MNFYKKFKNIEIEYVKLYKIFKLKCLLQHLI